MRRFHRKSRRLAAKVLAVACRCLGLIFFGGVLMFLVIAGFCLALAAWASDIETVENPFFSLGIIVCGLGLLTVVL